ncbi:hypothetical protein GCM10022251_41970 [Phytohabitans flavus]
MSASAAARTRAASSGATVVLPFITRETVARETPAASATRLIVAAVGSRRTPPRRARGLLRWVSPASRLMPVLASLRAGMSNQ